MVKFIIQTVIFLVVVGILGSIGINIYSQFYSVPSNSPQGSYSFVVKSGQTLDTIGNKLQNDNVINSRQGFLIQSRLHPVNNLQPGEYTLQLPATPAQILEQINTRAEEIAAIGTKPTANVTFKEGETLDQIIFKLDQAGITPYQDLQKFAKNPQNFDRKAFPFLPSPLSCTYGNIQQCAKYYPEGYLYPDTYQFFKPSTPREVFERMLDNFDAKVWQKVSSKVGNKNFHQVIIMAAVIEKETGRPGGVTASNRGTLNTERRTMAGVFNNRLASGMRWQSDPTIEYGQQEIVGRNIGGKPKNVLEGRRICQQTIKIENCFFLDSPEADTKYNTYRVTGYPIGPTTSPQLENIQAVLDPIPNDYLFFVSDATGKKYFASTDAQHVANIQQVQRINAGL